MGAFVEAVHNHSPNAIAEARERLYAVTEVATTIDAAGVIAAFHGLNLVADATGCGLGIHDDASVEVRTQLGLGDR